MKKYKVTIREVIEHTLEVEDFNKDLAVQKARKVLKQRLKDRIWGNTTDIVEEIWRVAIFVKGMGVMTVLKKSVIRWNLYMIMI